MLPLSRPPAHLAVSILLVLSGLAAPGQAQRAQRAQRAERAPAAGRPGAAASDLLSALTYRHVGPIGNRTIAVAGVPGDPRTYYVGAASGGIFKSTDGGVHWDAIFDDQPVSSVGALAVAASDPNIVWAGTGESFIRSHISLGWGVFKSTDAGKTWRRMGLEATGRIARVVIHPQNPDQVLVCALGHAYGPQPERGVFRTLDGGTSWERVLFVDQNTGCSDLAMDPNNPRILFAGMWQIEIHTWGRESGGPGSGLFTSRDGGATWRRLTGHGLPTRPVGKVAVAIAPSNSNHLYALIETGDGVPWHDQPTDSGELWTSEDGGATWTLTSHDRDLAGRTHYYSRVVVAPDVETEAHFLAGAYNKTIDGGRTTLALPGSSRPGGDNHDMWIDPLDPGRMIVANDQGLGISTTRGRAWERIQLPIAQMYHVEADNAVPYFLYGNRQDGPSFRVPSNSRGGGFGGGFGGNSIPRGEWHSVGGGESGWATPDPTDPNVIWSSASGSGSVGGIVVRFDERNRQFRQVEIWPERTGGWPAAELKYRFVWTAPLTISPHDHNTVYLGSQFVHRTSNGGQSWQVISPDLTLNDKSRQQISGGLTPDNIGVEYAGVVFAIAESPLQRGLIWAGTNDGLLHLTRDGGATWTNVTAALPGLPPWLTVSSIEPSRHDTGTAYVAIDGHQSNSRDPWIYRTADFGKTWQLIVTGIPKSPLSYVHVVKEDPVRRGLLYAGTENALYVSFDAGDHWQPLQSNLPPAPVYWLTIQNHFNDLTVATYGRGFYILDDLTPLQQLTPEVLAAEQHLFAPRPAYRFRPVQGAAGGEDPSAGENPRYGASLNYWLQAPPEGPVTLTIKDAAGAAVRTLTGTKRAGLNRVYWDLEDEPTPLIRLRVKPQDADWVDVPPEGRPAPGAGRVSMLMPPGEYTVTLSAGGREHSQPLTVRKDPNSSGTLEDIGQQIQLLRAVKADVATVAGILNGIEGIRRQLQEVRRLPGNGPADVRAAADSLEAKFVALEGTLHQLRYTGRGQDGVRWPGQLVQKLTYLAGGIATADFPPTDQQREVQQLLAGQTGAARARFDGLVRQDLAAFNALLRQRNIGIMVAGAP